VRPLGETSLPPGLDRSSTVRRSLAQVSGADSPAERDARPGPRSPRTGTIRAECPRSCTRSKGAPVAERFEDLGGGAECER